MLIMPVRKPVREGANVTETVQLAPGPICVPQVLVWEKSLALESSIWVKFNAPVPVFLMVTNNGALLVPTFVSGKLSFFGEICTTVPAPASSTTWGLEEALSVMVIVPLFPPLDCGRKSVLTLQLPPGETLPAQVVLLLLNRNWAPCTEMEEIDSAPVPVLVRVTLCGELVVPTNCAGKVTGLVGEKLTAPVLSRIVTSPLRKSATARSFFRSPLKSPTATKNGSLPTGYVVSGWKVPSPSPSKTLTVLFALAVRVSRFATARSGFPSPFKSATASDSGNPDTG